MVSVVYVFNHYGANTARMPLRFSHFDNIHLCVLSRLVNEDTNIVSPGSVNFPIHFPINRKKTIPDLFFYFLPLNTLNF